MAERPGRETLSRDVGGHVKRVVTSDYFIGGTMGDNSLSWGVEWTNPCEERRIDVRKENEKKEKGDRKYEKYQEHFRDQRTGANLRRCRT